MTTISSSVREWRVAGSYFEGCNCDPICPCRSVKGLPGGASSHGVCFGALSWHVIDGEADGLDLSDSLVVMTLRYRDDVQPSTKWEVALYLDDRKSDEQHAALAAIFLGQAGGTVARQYGPAIGDVRAIRRAHIALEHGRRRKRIAVTGFVVLEAEEAASEPGDVACGIPGLDRPGTELVNDVAHATDPALHWDVVGRGASFTTDFDYRSDTRP